MNKPIVKAIGNFHDSQQASKSHYWETLVKILPVSINKPIDIGGHWIFGKRTQLCCE